MEILNILVQVFLVNCLLLDKENMEILDYAKILGYLGATRKLMSYESCYRGIT